MDYVLPFDEATVDGILKELKPDILSLGTDCAEENESEREAIRAFGGRITFVRNPKNHSTRDLIQTILSKFHS